MGSVAVRFSRPHDILTHGVACEEKPAEQPEEYPIGHERARAIDATDLCSKHDVK